MGTVTFEEVVCRRDQATNDKYRLVLFANDQRKDELRSTYQRGKTLFGWKPLFKDPVEIPISESPLHLAVELREKAFIGQSGRNVCSYRLNLSHNCRSSAFSLQRIASSMASPPEISVTVTVAGLPPDVLEPGSSTEPSATDSHSPIASQVPAPSGPIMPYVVPPENGTTNSSPPIEFPSPRPASPLSSPTSPPVPILHFPSPNDSDKVPDFPSSNRPLAEQSVQDAPYPNRTLGASKSAPNLVEPHPIDPLLLSAENAAKKAALEQASVRQRSHSFTDTIATVEPVAPDAEDIGGAMWSGASRLDAIVQIIDVAADIHPLVKGAWSLLNVAYTMAKAERDLDTQIESLVQALDVNCAFAKTLAANDLTEIAASIVRNILREVKNGAILIDEYCAVRKTKTSMFRFATSTTSVRVEACLQTLEAFQRHLAQHITAGIQHDLQALSAKLSNEMTILNTKLDQMNERAQIQELLSEMPYAPTADRAMRSDERGCLPGTRGEIIESLVRWAAGASADSSQSYIRGLDPNSRILWLCGVAGSGKSSIAISIARLLKEENRLGALYGFETAFQTSLNPTNLFSTIARQRAERQRAYQQHLLRTLECMDHDKRASTSASQQFKSFITTPKAEDEDVLDDVVIIDAFDESGSTSARSGVLQVLSPTPRDPSFPRGVRFIVTSRYEHDIAARLDSVLSGAAPLVSILHMEDIKPLHTERDIRLYVLHKLDGVVGLEASRAAQEITQLAMAAQHSFQWASTACLYITQDDDDALRTPIIRLREILATGVGLDALYLSILNQHFKSSITQPPSTTRPLRIILGSLVCALEPLSIGTIASLATANTPDSDTSSYRPIARRLSSIVTGTHDEVTPLVPLHTSFTDFLRDPERSGKYAVVSQNVHAMLGLACLAVMKESLRFNICRLESSFLRNADVSDLAERVKKHISDELSYACRFWPVHVAAALSAASGHTEAIWGLLSEFLENKLRVLQWLEVMSVTRSNAWSALSSISFLQGENSHLRDLITFTTYFAIPISTSVPHIYLSALAFTPSASLIFPMLSQFPNLVQLSKPLTLWPRIRHRLEHASAVQSVVFSPDGRRLVSGERDGGTYDTEDSGGGLVLWDAYSGMVILPRISTTSACLSVAFSPNKTVLASGHRDGTIQLWDANTMTARGKPLTGHTGWVQSLSFSPDGALLASGSDDETIRFWDPLSGSAVGEPLTGHGGSVLSVTFSPNGLLLASGSADNYGRFWDVRTLAKIGEPLRGHSDWVRTVAFSSDSTLLATGADDKTIGLWDVQSGSAVGKLFSGHDGYVRSVSFSPDGYTLASCSDDKTVRLWDLRTKSSLGEPLTAHTDRVVSIAFSVDSVLLASASFDKTVHVWDARVLGEIEGASAAQLKIQSFAAFSRDGTLLASGSGAFEIQLWDVRFVSTVGEPFRGHTNDINCVAFSPDGTLLASGSDDETLRLWDVRTGSTAGEPLKGNSGWVHAIAFSPDGSLLASGSTDYMIRLWDVASRSAVEVPLEGHSSYVMCVAFSPDGELLASGSSDNTIRLWDVRTRSLVEQSLTGHSDWIDCVTFSPDGALIASGSENGELRIWDVRTCSLVKELLHRDAGGIRCVAWSPDGTLLASSANNGTVQLWDLRTFNAIGEPLQRHTGSTNYLAFSPDGTRLTSTARGDSICYWDVTSILRDASLASDSGLQQSQRAVLPVIDPVPSLSSHAFMSLEDGWVVGQNKELILWIPPALRSSLSNVYEIPGPGSPPLVRLDFSKFVCGPDWAKCYSPSSDSVAPVLS